jgi:hypothetical protein
MARGTKELVTMWTPFGDCDTTMGTLAVIEGSNHRPEFQQLQQTQDADLFLLLCFLMCGCVVWQGI